MQNTPYVPLPYPSIFGSDIAGTIVQLGSSVTRFMIGQRVIGECDNLLTQNPGHAGFQRFATCAEIMVAAIPDSLPLANAAVLPLCYSTAGCALFKHFRLPLPSLDPKPIEKTILLWGGSSSVGCSAIQYVRYRSTYIIFIQQTLGSDHPILTLDFKDWRSQLV